MAVELEPKHKRARTRSPSYPYLALPDALEKAATLWRAESRHAVSVSVAMQHWGYKAESSTGFSCIAALKKFALVDEEGVGEHREVKLSNLALTVILDDTDSPERKTALRTAALSPGIHAELWERYGADLPSDQSLKRFLVIEKNFNESSVDEFLAEYRATIAFAELHAASSDVPVHSESGAPRQIPPPTLLFKNELPTPRAMTDPRPGLRGNPGGQKDEPSRVDGGSYTGEAGHARRSSEPSVEARTTVPAPLGSVVASGVSRPPTEKPAESADGNGKGSTKELLVPLENDQVARVPYPMSEEDFALFIDTLQLWKKRLVRPSTR